MSHQSNPGLFVSASNQTDMLKWFEVLDAELSKINQTESTIEDTTSTPPHKQENTIEANKVGATILSYCLPICSYCIMIFSLFYTFLCIGGN